MQLPENQTLQSSPSPTVEELKRLQAIPLTVRAHAPIITLLVVHSSRAAASHVAKLIGQIDQCRTSSSSRQDNKQSDIIIRLTFVRQLPDALHLDVSFISAKPAALDNMDESEYAPKFAPFIGMVSRDSRRHG